MQIPANAGDTDAAPVVSQAVITETVITEVDDGDEDDIVVIDDEDDEDEGEGIEEAEDLDDDEVQIVEPPARAPQGGAPVDTTQNDIQSSGEEEEPAEAAGIPTGNPVGTHLINPFIDPDDVGFDPDDAGFDPEDDDGDDEIFALDHEDGYFDGMSAEDAHYECAYECLSQRSES